MRLVSLDVTTFGPIRSARVGFGNGLNVLYGRNDLGKSHLVSAIRSALLLPHTSTAAEQFVEWGTDETPSVELVFETDDGRFWRIHKSFSKTAGGKATLERSTDGQQWALETKGRDVEGRLRGLLGWGIPEPGGKGKRLPKGLPSSFLTNVFLPAQHETESLFGRGLDDDLDESGKRALTAALQTFAQDPLFAAVLAQAQNKVDEAYYPSGKPRRAKNDPFAKTALEVRSATKELETRTRELEKTHLVRTSLEDIRARAEAVEFEKDLAEKDLLVVQDQWQKVERYTGLRKQLDQRLEQRDHQRDLEARRQALDDQLIELRLRLTTLADQLAREDELFEEARRRNQSLLDSQADLRRLELEKELLHIDAEKSRVDRMLEDSSAQRRMQQTITRLEANIESSVTPLEADQQRLAEISGRKEHLTQLRYFLLSRQAQQKLEAGRQRTLESAELEARAAQLRQRAEQLRQQVAERVIPTREEFLQVRDLRSKERIARQRLDTGLHVSVEAEDSVELRIEVDGQGLHAPESAEIHTVTARSHLALELAGLAHIKIRAGDAGHLEQADELTRRWQQEGLPVLERAQVSTLTELERAIEISREQSLESERLSDQAAELEGRLQRLPAPDIAALEREVDTSTARFDGGDQQLLEREAEALEETSIEQQISAIEDLVKELDSEGIELRERAARQQVQVETDRARLADLRSELDQTTAGRAPSSDLESIQNQRQQLEVRAQRVQGEIEAHNARLAAERKAADDSLRQITEQRQQTSTEIEAAETELSRWNKELAGIEGRLQEHNTTDNQNKLEELLVQVDAARAAVDSNPSCSAADLEAAEQRVDEARQAGARVALEASKLEGALQQVGGDVAEQREKASREALFLAKEREAETELEYQGWKTLVEALREAENEESSHLGQALVKPVGERFSQLTDGRYGTLGLDPHLRTTGIEVRGFEQRLSQLSQGVREQLAALMRISIANHLRTAIVLDDHLTHTDPDRLDWFGNVLLESAQDHQILIFTCRPQDYLPAQATLELEVGEQRVKSIDLESLIDRVDYHDP